VSEPGTSRWLSFRSSVLDRVGAVLLLVILAPLLATLGLAVRLLDGKPAFVRVPRSGRDGVLFGMWKLRSMRADLPGGLAGGADLTARDDDRITSIGRRLRRYRLDELPQLVNVARGEMALIGPRPEAPGYVSLGDSRWREVLAVPPGIAGASQALLIGWEAGVLRRTTGDAAYRGEILPVKLAVDDWYVRKATPALDLLVVVSIVSALGGRRRGRLLRRVRAEVREAAAIPDA
jgi:lipopolysaccharide/colanic/teichoic acid biosynthesis glycosyltransferase